MFHYIPLCHERSSLIIGCLIVRVVRFFVTLVVVVVVKAVVLVVSVNVVIKIMIVMLMIVMLTTTTTTAHWLNHTLRPKCCNSHTSDHVLKCSSLPSSSSLSRPLVTRPGYPHITPARLHSPCLTSVPVTQNHRLKHFCPAPPLLPNGFS